MKKFAALMIVLLLLTAAAGCACAQAVQQPKLTVVNDATGERVEFMGLDHYIDEPGSYTAIGDGSPVNEDIYINLEEQGEVTLTLKNVRIRYELSDSNFPPIDAYNADLTLVLEGENALHTENNNIAVSVHNGDLTIRCKDANQEGHICNGACGKLSVSSAGLENGEDIRFVRPAIAVIIDEAGGTLNMNGGYVTAEGGNARIYGKNEEQPYSSTFGAAGVYAEASINMNGGCLAAKGGSSNLIYGTQEGSIYEELENLFGECSEYYDGMTQEAVFVPNGVKALGAVNIRGGQLIAQGGHIDWYEVENGLARFSPFRAAIADNGRFPVKEETNFDAIVAVNGVKMDVAAGRIIDVHAGAGAEQLQKLPGAPYAAGVKATLDRQSYAAPYVCFVESWIEVPLLAPAVALPGTGDDSRLMLWIALAGISISVFALRRRENA